MSQILPHFNISEQGLRELELWLEKNQPKIEWGPWIYVGTYPGDQDTTIHSPAFQNGVMNAAGGKRRLRFRAITPRTFRKTNSLQFSGSVVQPADGTVVTNVAAIYRPSETEWGTGANDDGSIDVWRLDTNGDLVYVSKSNGVGGIRYDFDNVGDWLSVAATGTDPTTGGAVAFTLPDSGDFYILDHLGNIRLGVGDLGDIVAITASDGTQSFAVRGDDALDRLVVQPTIGITLTLDTGDKLLVKDSVGSPIFEVDENGDLHGKTGKALTFDL